MKGGEKGIKKAKEKKEQKMGKEKEKMGNNRARREDHGKRRQGDKINKREIPKEQEKKVKQLNNENKTKKKINK